jgi:hypothetical protein
MGEDKVSRFDELVASKTGLVHRFVSRLAVFELSTPQAAGSSVLF